MITRLADTSDVDAAVINALQTDAALMALTPDGVFWDYAPTGSTRYVVVQQDDHVQSYVQQSVLWERILYSVISVIQSASGTESKAAAARIRQILQDARFPIPNYAIVKCDEAGRIPRRVEIDEETDQRWQWRGGQYEVIVAPTA